jgi:DNA-binding XRE family transcriptional regulator
VKKPSYRKWKALSDAERAICRRFARLREGRGREQTEWAKLVGLSINQLASIETGRVGLKWQVFRKVLDVCPVNPRWLAEGIGPVEITVALPVEVGRKAPKNALFSEMYAAQVKPMMDEQLSQALTVEFDSLFSLLVL